MKKQLKKAVTFGLKKVCLHCVPPQHDKMLSYAQAEQILRRHSPAPGASCPADDRQTASEYDLSILVPVFPEKADLSRCLNSVIAQKTDFRWEVILVNPGTAIAEQYRGRENFRVISNLNRGFREVRGKYVMFLDADGFLGENAMQSLLKAAVSRNADLVQGGCDPAQEQKLIWGKVFRTQLWQYVCFPEGYWFEDTLITSLLTQLASNVVTISEEVSCGRKQDRGISGTDGAKPGSIDTFYVLRSVLEARRTLGLPTDSAFYEDLMGLMIQCMQRTRREPRQVQKSIFTLFQVLLQQERCRADVHLRKQYDQLENLLIRGDYRKFRLMCALW